MTRKLSFGALRRENRTLGPAPGDAANAEETYDHHRPRRRLGHCGYRNAIEESERGQFRAALAQERQGLSRPVGDEVQGIRHPTRESVLRQGKDGGLLTWIAAEIDDPGHGRVPVVRILLGEGIFERDLVGGAARQARDRLLDRLHVIVRSGKICVHSDEFAAIGGVRDRVRATISCSPQGKRAVLPVDAVHRVRAGVEQENEALVRAINRASVARTGNGRGHSPVVDC